MPDTGDALNKLARSSSIVFTGTIIGQGIGLFGEIIIVRSLSPKVYGQLALAYTFAIIGSSLLVFGAPKGITRMMSADVPEPEQIQIIRSGGMIVVGMMVVTTIGLLVSREWIASYLEQPSLSKDLLLFIPILIFFPLGKVVIGVLRARGRSFGAVIARYVGSRVFALSLLGAGITFGTPVLGAIGYWVAFPILLLVISIYFLQQEFALGDLIGRPNGEQLSRVWAFSWPIAITSSFVMLLSNVDIVMISYFLPSEQIGFYRSLQPLRKITTFVLTSFVFMYTPLATQYFANGEEGSLNELYRVSSKWITLVTFPFVLVFVVFSSDVIRVFFSAEYVPAAPALSVLIAGLFIKAFLGPNGATVKAINRPRMELLAAGIGLLVNVVLNATLIPLYGIVGAAAATAAGFIVYNVSEVVVIYAITGGHPFSINTIKPLLPTALAAIVFHRAFLWFQQTLVSLVAIGILISIVQLSAVFLTKSLEPADIVIIEAIEERVGVNLSSIKDQV
ncbi:polysaccharide biosynthesis C-terminal domain-containing protein [Halorientalis pallida]|uniref:oligosaccharide flippase family protein n=1 Tax=Halorientalis pallida TaxID=2479928 RepID=UPI003C705529